FRMRRFPEQDLLPLDGARWLRANVVNHAGHTTNFIDDACRNALQDLSGQANPVGSHGIVGFDDADGDGEAVGAVVAHNANAANREQDGKGLPNFTVEAGATYLFDNDGVGLLQSVEVFSGDLPKKPDGEAWAGKRVFQK